MQHLSSWNRRPHSSKDERIILTSGHRSDDRKRLGPRRGRVGERGVRQFVGEIAANT